MSRVLVLTVSCVPHKVTSWGHAVGLVFGEPSKAEIVEHTGEPIYTTHEGVVIHMPSVIRLTKPIEGMKRAVKFSRVNVLTRDGYRCCYCLAPKKAKELNYDHVLPRHLGGRTTWENIVSSCYPCNSRKANRTPEQARMTLRQKPHRPKTLPMVVPRFDPRDIPESWVSWVRDFFVDEAVA